MSQTINSDTAAMEAARREMQGILAALQNRRHSTDMEVEEALRKLGYNPKTVTVNGLCTCIYEGFYKAQTDIQKHKRKPESDCLRCTVFGQACDYLGLITDEELRVYLWDRSGTMANVNNQPVRLCEIVAYLNKRDADRKARRATQEANVAAKLERSSKAATAEANITMDTLVSILVRYKIVGSEPLPCLLNLMLLPDSHPAKRELFSSD